MHLKISTDYAVRIVLYLAKKRQLVQSKELSEQLHIPQGYVLKVASILKEAQILEAVTGIDGGFRLVKHPRDIPSYDVIRAMETTMQINRCLEKDRYCSRDAGSFCQVRHFYEKIQSYLDHMLLSTSIQELLEME